MSDNAAEEGGSLTSEGNYKNKMELTHRTVYTIKTHKHLTTQGPKESV